MLQKARIFVSHIQADASIAAALKSFLVGAYSGAIEVFVSSDNSSIAGGDAWFAKIMKAINAILRRKFDAFELEKFVEQLPARDLHE